MTTLERLVEAHGMHNLSKEQVSGFSVWSVHEKNPKIKRILNREMAAADKRKSEYRDKAIQAINAFNKDPKRRRTHESHRLEHARETLGQIRGTESLADPRSD